MPRYKPSGPFQKSVTYRRWVIVDADGEEFPCQTKKLAFFLAKNSIRTLPGLKLYEETKIRTYRGLDVIDKSFRIDITNQIKR